MTYRAVRVLKEVSVIACEDTRHSRKLLDHYGIETRLVSYHEHNEAARTQQLIELLRAGDSVALVSDAGTPLISDPGYRVVQAVAAEGIRVIPIPGPSAVIAALSVSGLPTDAFRFCGFLPPKASHRRKTLESVASDPATLIFYEAPHRIAESLSEMRAVLGDRPAVLGRELTKLHEELIRGSLDELIAEITRRPSVKGEFTVLVGWKEAKAVPTDSVFDAVRKLEAEGVARMEAMKRVARERGMSKREVYRIVEAGQA